MSTRPNHRRSQPRIQDNGPTWEGGSAGCNDTHVARSRRKWKRVKARSERRTGKTSPKVWVGKARVRPSMEVSDGDT